jgi:antitoxin component YwqK of YwqJK toxin-antitoxin module
MRSSTFILVCLLLLSCEQVTTEKITQTWDDGSPRTIMVYNEDGSELIKQIVYYNNGNLNIEGEFNEGERHGTWTSYYVAGSLWTINNYENGVLEGEYLMYNENGTLRIQGFYSEGEESGHWDFHDDDGEFLESRDF